MPKVNFAPNLLRCLTRYTGNERIKRGGIGERAVVDPRSGTEVDDRNDGGRWSDVTVLCASSSSIRTARKRRWRQNKTTPTFIRSPRSIRGTTRRIVYWNGLRSRIFGLRDEFSRGLEPRPEERLEVGPPLRRSLS